MALTDLQWLRKLIEDELTTENESSAASGAETTFFVGNPPIIGTPTVGVNGVPKQNPADWTNTSRYVVFGTAPAANATVTIQYDRQSFTDDELNHYLTQAQLDFDDQRLYVYQAAVYAIDSMLLGASTALNFGAGAENYDMVSVWNRLTKLREMYMTYISDAASNDPVLVIQDMEFTKGIYDHDSIQFPYGYDPDAPV